MLKDIQREKIWAAKKYLFVLVDGRKRVDEVEQQSQIGEPQNKTARRQRHDYRRRCQVFAARQAVVCLRRHHAALCKKENAHKDKSET